MWNSQAKNEDGEFELILGNRQLLSVFFIVVILLGVFFTMGYIVGRNSAPAGSTDVASARKPEGKPVVVESTTPREPGKAVETPAGPVTTAAQQPEVKEPKKPEPVKIAEKKPEPIKPKPEPLKPTTDLPASGQTYLQLAATTQHEANIEVDVLRKKGFKAIAAEIPEKPGTFRVLVGPLAEANLNKTKTDLQGAGFPGEKAIRRTF